MGAALVAGAGVPAAEDRLDAGGLELPFAANDVGAASERG
jgi:hypothetical protein